MRQAPIKTGYLVKVSHWDANNKLVTTYYKNPSSGPFYSKISTARASCKIPKDRIDKSEVIQHHKLGTLTATYTILKATITWETMDE